MVLMEQPPIEPGRLVVTPHPVTLDGQTNVAAELMPGESLYAFLARNIDPTEPWEVRIGGVVIGREHWDRIRPKHGQMIEVRGAVNKQALYIVAMVALAYFTMGIGTAVAGTTAGAALGFTGTALTIANAAIFMAGSVLINKALGPSVGGGGSALSQPDSVYTLGAARNRARPYEPFALMFGSRQITPDLASNPYTRYQGNDQFVSFVLNAGINVDRIDVLSNGDTLLSSYDEVTTYTAGFPGMPEQEIPQYTNADTTSGGELAWEGGWVERTTSPDTVRIEIGIEYILYDNDNDGKPYYNQETVVAEYRPVGTTTWLSFATVGYRHNKPDTRRSALVKDVAKGQYDVRVHRLGRAGKEKGAFSQFQWTTLVSVQTDDTDYSGISRIGVTAKATGQLNGPMDEVRGVGHAAAMPIWDGTAWQTATTRETGLSNPGAQILQYARGFRDGNSRLIAGIGLADEQIDIEALKAFMLHCTAEGYTYDNYVQSVRSHDDMLAAIALAGFGQVTWAGGRLSVNWAADEQPLSGVVNMATIKKGQFQVDYTLANAADGIEYTYFDRETWQPQTLRVAAPGVTTMLNPATLTGEGVTTEAHAAQLARYHLAQHLYQYKDISYSTDLEHLSYRRLSVLALQHDLTKWGKGGRLMAAVDNAGTVTLSLDEPVPAPAAGNAYIGLRIPGENVYRIFTVASFEGESDTITLTEPWPVDAALPGDDDANPAHDTIWIYDFQQTPGYRVRVVGVEPESGLKGASVAVVPEPPEFWTYVKTGEYTPPVVNPMLPARPTVSGLQVTETKTVQGDTVFTELSVTFDVTGPMAYASIHAAYYVDSDSGYEELREVAQTQTRTAKFRIGAAGTYAIVVRPYDANGIVGGVASTTYTTIGAEIAPSELDYFTVTELDGGVRKYAFGYDETTIKPPDYAGAEIRYITGNVVDPDWAAMTPLGEDGFFTSAVEMVMPPAGLWTFAARPRSTGKLLGPMTVVTTTLTENLGEIGQQTGAEIAQIIEDQLTDAQNLADETIARQTNEAAAALERAQLVADQAVLRSQIGDILQADVHDPLLEYPEGDMVQFGDPAKLYRAIQDVPVGIAITNAAYWEVIGNYASLGEAVGAVAAQVEVHNAEIADLDGDLTAVSETVTQHAARMPAGSGKLGTDARITSVESAAAAANTATANRVTVTEARIGDTLDNLCPKSIFEDGQRGVWGTAGTVVDVAAHPSRTKALAASVSVYTVGAEAGYIPCKPGDVFDLQADISGQNSPSGATTPRLQYWDKAGSVIGYSSGTAATVNSTSWQLGYNPNPAGDVAPAGSAYARPGFTTSMSSGNMVATNIIVRRRSKAEQGALQSIDAINLSISQQDDFIQATADDLEALDLQVQNPTTGLNARAKQTDFASLKSRVDTVGGGIETIASDLNAVEASVAGKASAAAFNALDAQVNHATTGLATKASSTAVTQVSARLAAAEVPGLNLVYNPSGAAGLVNWRVLTGTVSWLTAGQFGEGHRFRMRSSGAAFRAATETITVLPNTAYTLSAEFNGAGDTPVQMRISFYNSSGGFISASPSVYHDGSGWIRRSTSGVSPAGTAFALVDILRAAGSNTDIHWRNVKLEASSVATPFTDDASIAQTATATQVLRADVDSVTGKVEASYTVAFDVNGRTTGVIAQADGTETEWTFLTDRFSVVDPDGGARLEWSDGNQRVYDAAGVLRVRLGVW